MINFFRQTFKNNNMFNAVLLKNRLLYSESYFKSMTNGNSVTTDHSSVHASVSKPPNVLLYSPTCKDVLEKHVLFLEQCFDSSRYTVYPITTTYFKTDPWMENTEALIVWSSDLVLLDKHLVKTIKDNLKQYLLLGGKVLTFNCNFAHTLCGSTLLDVELNASEVECKFGKLEASCNILLPNNAHSMKAILQNDKDRVSLADVTISDTTHCVACRMNGTHTSILCTLPWPSLYDDNRGQKILSYLLHCMGLHSTWNSLEKDDKDSLNRCVNKAYLYATDKVIQGDFFKSLSLDTSSSLSLSAPGLKFVSSSDAELASLEPSDSQMLVIYDDDKQMSCGRTLRDNFFKWETYRNNLTSKNYGKLVVYADIITSTMSVFDGISFKLPDSFGAIAIARQQTKGKGRSSNKWLSPIGCAMFTLTVHIPLRSRLGLALPFLQHITSVAVVHGIRTLPGLQDVNLSVKWPNDIYFGSTVKLGGVIVKSTIFRDTCIAAIGCGVNIANKKPTACVNDILKDEYSIQRDLLCEEVIARTVSSIEELIGDFQSNGPESFLQLYYKYWIHGNSNVGVEIDGAMIDCLIAGVDDCGFLRARRHDNGEVVSLHPDGNTFDITKNLIVAKK